MSEKDPKWGEGGGGGGGERQERWAEGGGGDRVGWEGRGIGVGLGGLEKERGNERRGVEGGDGGGRERGGIGLWARERGGGGW